MTEELKGRIVVYSIVGCPHCMKAKSTLHDLNLPYTDIGVDIYPHFREEVKKKTGQHTVPQIYFNSIHIGGNSDLQELIKDREKFARVLDEVKKNSPPKDAPQPPSPRASIPGASVIEAFICEPDEYAALVRDLRKSGTIHKKGLTTLEKSFKGKDFVDWCVKTKQIRQLGEMMHKAILELYNTFLSPDGKTVDYKGMMKSNQFNDYVQLTRELQRVKIEDANREEKLSFFINIYNALVIHANVARGLPSNLWQRYKFFNTVQYIIGGLSYSLQEIENGVLRANRRGVGQIFPPFSRDDPRLKIALERPEPLIHFALVCGTKSCPPIKTYTAANIDKELQTACEAFLEGDDACLVDTKNNAVKLSRIFSWYHVDFGKDDPEMLAWIVNHMSPGKKRDDLANMKGKISVSYIPYDWSSNAKS